MNGMRAIDFNLWMTLIAMTKGRVDDNGIKQYVVVPQKNILPEYPRDLSKFAKPSIIIQKVADDISDTCFDRGFIGQVFDGDIGAMVDVYSKSHDLQFQFDVFADSNTQCSLITSMLVDDMFTNRDITIMDYVGNIKSPVEMGVAKLRNDMDVIPMNGNENHDYRTAIRFYMNVIQTIIPKQEFVDLSKWIKIYQKVTI